MARSTGWMPSAPPTDARATGPGGSPKAARTPWRCWMTPSSRNWNFACRPAGSDRSDDMRFKRLGDIDLKGRRVFIRSDLNVPMDENDAITDDTRIRASVPAIAHCLEQG